MKDETYAGFRFVIRQMHGKIRYSNALNEKQEIGEKTRAWCTQYTIIDKAKIN